MEELKIKFYSVKIGTRTRAGNMNVIHSFVAQSDKDQNSVYKFYSSKYNGLAVEVSQITEIVKDEIPKTADPHSYGMSSEEQKIQELEEQVKKLQSNSSFDRFTGTVRFDRIGAEIKTKFDELYNLNIDYKDKKQEIRDSIKSFIKDTKYKELDIHEVSVGDFDHTTENIPFTIKLSGKIESSNNIVDK